MKKSNLGVSQLALIEACKQLKIPYSIKHKDKILIIVDLPDPLFFVHHHKAFDREDMMRICRDKDLSYTILKDAIRLPKWKSYLDPNCEPQYQHLVEYKDLNEIIRDIHKVWEKPVIVKKNRGSGGENVFLCKNRKDIERSVSEIFNQKSKAYDYLAIAQEYVNIKKEYRIVTYKGKALLVYEKDTSNAVFTGNLSPLHWEGAKAVHVRDDKLIQKLEIFVKPIFKKLPLRFVGIDVAFDKQGKLYLLEVNKSPGVNIFVRDNSIKPIVDMTKLILEDLLAEQKKK